MDNNATEASKEAVHKARNAAQAIEFAREVQLAKVVEDTAMRTKSALLEGLKEVFGDSESRDPTQMKILIHRIPVLCVRIDTMDKNIQELKDSQKWAVRIVVGLFIAAVAKMVFLP